MRPLLKAVARLAFACAALSALASPQASAATLPGGFRDEVVFSGLTEPTAVAFAPDGRVFVAEKAGTVLVFDGIADETPEEFADLRTEVYDSGDRGLLGLAVDPAFPARPYVYVLYTYDHVLGEGGGAPRWGLPDQEGDGCPELKGADACLVSGRLARLTAEGDEAVGELPLVEGWCQQFSSHSVGDVRFGPDGALYASGGDGASFTDPDFGQFGTPPNPCGDPDEEGGALRSQDLRTMTDPAGLGGSLIRVDPDSGEGLPGNPMFGSLDANARRIVAYGFRNPFRFTIAPDRDQVYVGNVGWNTYEEIDRFEATSAAPHNSGWPCYEGLGKTAGYASLGLDLCESLGEGGGEASPPFFVYRHGSGVIPEDTCRSDIGSAVSGMAIYAGGDFPPTYDGALFFADPVRGCVFVMYPGENGVPDPLTTTPFLVDEDDYPGVDLEVGPGGDLYYVKLDGEDGVGTAHRISYDPDAPVARLVADPRWGDEDPLEVHLDASDSTDPQGEDLGFEWDLDENGTFETVGGAERTEMLGGDEDITVSVRVSDEGGATSVTRVIVYPGDTPPQPEILDPEGGLTWAVGERIEFDGAAGDEEDGELPDSSLYWKARLYHCPAACHAHPLQVFPAMDSGSFVAPDHDYPAHLEISLTATDSVGLAATTSITIHPRPVDLTIESDPPGVELTAGLVSGPAPFELRAIESSDLVLSAPRLAELNGREYAWVGWSDGGERVHTILAEEPETYTASYEAVEEPLLLGPANPPQTTLIGHPGRRTRRLGASFGFSSDQPDARFRCKLDGAPFAPCRSPRAYRHLRPGRHRFKVFAIDVFGNADLSPARFSWRVLAPRGRPSCRSLAATQPLRACAKPAGAAGRRGR